MCRAAGSGSGGRCSHARSYAAVARANGNRRLSRLARSRVVKHLEGEGLLETARAVQAAPPSALPRFMAELGVDPAVLGEVDMPKPGPRPADAGALVALAKTERARVQQARANPPRRLIPAAPRAAAKPNVALRALLAKRFGSAPGAAGGATGPQCRSSLALIQKWEMRAEEVFAAEGSRAACRAANAEAEMLCKGCPLLEACAKNARATRYTGIAGGRIFINGRQRLTPSVPTRIVA